MQQSQVASIARSVARILLLLTLALVVIGLLVPNTTLRFFRVQYHWLGRFVNRVEGVDLALNMDHVVAFGLLGAMARAALPRMRTVWILVAVAILGAVSELLQFWVPGRDPRVSDVLTDLGGALLGIAVVALPVALWRHGRSR